LASQCFATSAPHDNSHLPVPAAARQKRNTAVEKLDLPALLRIVQQPRKTFYWSDAKVNVRTLEMLLQVSQTEIG
jgi:hypothetical protein